MVSSLEKRYLLSAGLSPLRTHFIASLKTSGTTITYSGYCHPLPPENSTTTQPKISTVCLSTSKRVKISSKAPFEIFWNQEGHEIIFLKKREEVPMILSKNSSKRRFNKMTQKCFQKEWVHFSLSHKYLRFHKIGIWLSTYLLRATLRLGNTGNQGMSHSSYP